MSAVRQIFRHPVSALIAWILIAWGLWIFRDIILLVFAALLLTMLLLPLVDGLEKRGFPRYLSAPVLIILLVGLVSLFVLVVVPPLASQAKGLEAALYHDFQAVREIMNRHFGGSQSAQGLLAQGGQTLFHVTTGALYAGSVLVAIIFISLYWLIDYRAIKKSLVSALPGNSHRQANRVIDRVEERMIAWLQGQVILSVIMGVLAAIAYWLIGLNFVLVLAAIAAVMEIIPFIGPFIAAVPAVLVALTISPGKALLTLIAYLVIQTIEANLLAPNIMARAVHLHPLMIILSFLIAGKIAGLPGVLLCVPIVLVLREVARGIQPAPTTAN